MMTYSPINSTELIVFSLSIFALGLSHKRMIISLFSRPNVCAVLGRRIDHQDSYTYHIVVERLYIETFEG